MYFTDLANPKNPNLNLDSTDYGCETCLIFFNGFIIRIQIQVTMAGLDWELLFLETEDLFLKKYCFESNENKCLEEIKKALII